MKIIIQATNEMVVCAQRNPNWVIIDARSSDAYIGWCREGERAGHIPYAKLFSSEWLGEAWRCEGDSYEALLDVQLDSQGITPDKKVIVYDECEKDAEKVLDYLLSKGIGNLYYYNLEYWDGDMSKYPNHQLIAPQWLVNDYLEGKENLLSSVKDLKIFEISWKEPSEEYLDHHIPGAVHIDSNEIEVPPMWIMMDDEALLDFARNNGISPDTTVIVYGNTTLNAMAAAKLLIVLRYIGVQKVMWLNGTIKNWKEAGYRTESGNVAKQPCGTPSREYHFERDFALHMDGARKLLEDSELGALVDTRSWRCFIGEYSGYPYLDKAGRIPGAVWSYYPKDYLSPTDGIGNIDVMTNILETGGVDMSKTVAFFCGSASWGAAAMELFAHVAGFEKATIYEGGWCEWCAYPENPCETGIPEKYKDYDPDHYQASRLMSQEACHLM